MTSQSPPTQKTSLTHNSSLQVNDVHSIHSCQSDLEVVSLAALQSLGSCIPMIPFQTFLDHLAPPQPNFDLDATMKSLKSGSEPALTSSNRWSKFADASNDSQGSENEVPSSMLDIFTNIVLAIITSSGGKLADHKRTVDFLQNPSRAPTSDERRNKSRPDGYLVLKDRNKKMSKDGKKEDVLWADIALSCEYKRNDTCFDLNDDVRKCIWSMQRVMREGPRRRASFGMTIENSTTRVWFCCRSSVVVSEPFDFINEPENLIKLFAAFAFADQKSLGFDSTVQPDTGNKGQFVVTVHPDDNKRSPRRFQTKEIISSSGAELPQGRGTRVYEAIEIGENGNPIGSLVVLKDTWIDSDRIREGKVLASIDAAVDGDDRILFERSFLTRICDGDVWTDFDTLDDTAHLMRGLNIDPKHVSLFELQQYPISESDEPPPGSEFIWAMTYARPLNLHPRYPPKTHYRIVFKEKCTPLYRIKSLPDVMTVLIETVRALQLLRKLGWVHRDVSIGNILSYNGHAKLSDLEYAKNMSDQSTHDMRTGTKHFMSVEVAAQGFLFFSAPLSTPRSKTLAEYLSTREQDKGMAKTNVPFSHNHLHDLESLWWVAVWLVFYHSFSEGTTPRDRLTLQDAMDQLILAQKLFPPVLDSITRHHGFKIHHNFKGICNQLPSNKRDAHIYLDILREQLIYHYEDVEAEYPLINPNASNDDIYDAFTQAFTTLKSIYHDFALEPIQEIYAELLKPANKRPRSESTNDTGVAQKNQRR